MSRTVLTIGAVAEEMTRRNPPSVVRPWHIRSAIRRGFLEEPVRLGVYRVFFADDLDKIEESLRPAGYLPTTCGAGAVSDQDLAQKQA
jgi:hypothetical protein